MASFLGASNSKRSLGRNSTAAINNANVEQKAIHLESLLRKLYSKCDELESLCQEEKEFHQLLKSKGRRGLPKLDNDCMNRVIASQQICAESAFNKLDDVKRGNRPTSSGRKKFANGDKEQPRHSGTENSKSSIKNSSNHIGGSSKELNKEKDYSNYGSLDRNYRKKKGSFLERNRRNTKTVGSLAGLDVVDNVELLKPDEQYNFGLPTVENKGIFDGSVQVSSMPHQIFSINSRGHPQLHNHHHHHHPPPTIHAHLPSSHSFGSNWPIQPPPPQINYDGFHRQSVFQRSSTSHDISGIVVQPKTSDIPYDPNLEASTSVSSPVTVFNEYLTSTDVNFNCLTISSPTDTSERGSSKSSENGDLKNSFVNESCKPFEMSDYYKYSTKYRSQKKGKIQTSKSPGDPKFHRANGTSDLRSVEVGSRSAGALNMNMDAVPPRIVNSELEVPHAQRDNPNNHQHHHLVASDNNSENSNTAPELPPKMRPSLMYNNSNTDHRGFHHHPPEMHKRNHNILNGQESDAWIHVNPTIV